ncbi:esterase/lipase [Paucibacter oligotrophus]|uniref:Esterase/lipase n=1 Tax=Roseateles oligotrophus TaxID=1769250 RepID=A0A840L9X3_9BURK|nr:alpha/beta fold hydrolase [Roseateles oligotrophus]MBB4843472.1 esterase/lipase [Roseateles oligotrophus]
MSRHAVLAEQLPKRLEQLDDYFAAQEARLGDVRPGAEKLIVWGDESSPDGHKRRAPWAVVYLHGFTATRQELDPVPQLVAQGLGAHLFYTRLSGHGRPGEAMERMKLSQWKADALEALAVGRMLGERVLVIGMSTGATLAAWAAQKKAGRGVAAWIMVSPNFSPKDPFAALLNWPIGRWLARKVHGPLMGAPAQDELRARVWTSPHPTTALFPMMALVAQVRASRLESVSAPLQILYSPRDTVIDVKAVRAAYARFGSHPKQLVEVNYSESPGQHVLAGAIEAPQASAPLAAEMLAFVQGLDAPGS